jgi:uncharacterized RDD family membrane protein YckC
MDDLNVIETPENVELRQSLCGIGTRFIAGLVDNMIILGLLLLLIMVPMLALSVGFDDVLGSFRWTNMWAWALLILAGFAIYWGYFVFFELTTNGQSPGKKSLKIRVVKEGGGAITFTDVAIRNLLRTVDGLPLYGLAGICMFVTKKAQRLGDLAAGTVVISEDVPDYLARTDSRQHLEWDQNVSPEALRASGLTPEEYRLLYNYWTRRFQLTLDARERILPQLLRPIYKRMGWTLETADVLSLESYLEQLIFPADIYPPEQDGTQDPGRQP